MKIRSGFISNSSTSNFIVRGYIIPRDKIDYKKFKQLFLNKHPEILEELKNYDEEDFYWEFFYQVRDTGYYITENTEDGAPTGCCLLGELLVDTGEDGYIPDIVIDCDSNDKLDELRAILKEVSDEEPKLKIVAGTRCC